MKKFISGAATAVKSGFNKVCEKAQGAALAVGGAIMVGLGSVQPAKAELPAAIGTELASVQADGLALADLVWPVVIALFGAVLLIKLFKRFGSKI